MPPVVRATGRRRSRARPPGTASAAPPPGFVGMTADDLYGNAGAYRDKGLAQLEAAGVQTLRVTFNWAAIEVARTASTSRSTTATWRRLGTTSPSSPSW